MCVCASDTIGGGGGGGGLVLYLGIFIGERGYLVYPSTLNKVQQCIMGEYHIQKLYSQLIVQYRSGLSRASN